MDNWTDQRNTLIDLVKFMIREVQLTVRAGRPTPYDGMILHRMNLLELSALRQKLSEELFDPDFERGE